MTAFVRVFFLIPLGFILAVFAASLVLLIGSTPATPLGDAERLVLHIFGAAIVGGFSLLPMAVAILAAAARRWRSLIVWLLIGGGLGLLGWAPPQLPPADYRIDAWVAVYLAAGFAGGFVYWLIAGRGAGAGFGRRKDDPAPGAASAPRG
jgi:hypothetical protein